MKKFLSKPGVLLSLLMLIFFAPGLAAILLYQHQTWLPQKTINRGHLVRPAQPMPGLGTDSKWRMVYWSSSPCQENCVDALDKLARIRKVLGRRYYQVDEWLLMPEANQPISAKANEQLISKSVRIKLINQQEQAKNTYFAKGSQFMLVSPDNYLVLTYKVDAPSEDLYKDLQHLLKNSKG